MVNWLIEASLRNRFLVLGLFVLVGAWGYWALLTTPIDAIPDLSDNQVIVFTDWTGRSPQEVEDQITYPLTVSLQGLPGVRVVRSSSAFGFSMINVIFEDNVDLYFARSRVLERLQLLSKSLPTGPVPTLGPDATGVGHVFWYTVEGKGHSLRDLRSLQDWFIRYQLNAVPGVAEVASIGGMVRQYQIDVDPNRLRAYKIPLSTVVDAVMRSNRNVGGNVVEASGTWSIVRGLGLVESTGDLEDVVVAAENGVPIFVRQVADVKVGDAFRAAALVKGADEAVGGVVVARYGVSTVDVINRVKEKIRALQAGLPPGVRIVPFYDRSALIERAVHTLRRALIEETIVVTLVNIVFLLHFRSVLIVTIPLPLAVLTAFLFMRYLDISSNIMSLAGIAIAIGVLVDAAIVVTENAFRFMEKRGVDPRDRRRVTEAVLDATRLVGRPIFFSMAIIILAFIPVFALTGQEGKLFHPLAFTKTFSMVGATMLAVTLVPVLCSLLIGGKIRGEESNLIMRPLVWLYRPLLDFALRHRAITLGIAVLTVAGALALVPRIGKEFMPPLNEGDLMFMPVTDPAISLTQAIEIVKTQNAAIGKFPEVASVVAKIARADTSTDPAPVNMTETIVSLKPESAWRPGMTREKLIGEMDAATTLPGVSNIWTQPIINRINMLTTGIRSEVGVKVFGNDLQALQERARAVADALRQIPGAADVYPEQVTGAPYLDIRVNREAAARYGITVGAIQDVVETAVGETNLTLTIEGRQRFPVRVRYAPEYRASAQALGSVLVTAPNGTPIPLARGIYLLYALGYNVSVAVWIGFIDLFGTAVQTAVVMVIYLEEAVAQKREELGGQLTPQALLEAVKEGALLRLRPKVMTVSTIVASLLPIMWSHSAGAEVMKPLATPVLGGMVSSLGLVLIVTPVIFYWLRERELRTAQKEGTSMRHVTAVVVAVVLLGVGTVWAAEKTVATKKTKDVVVTLKSESGQWKEGKNSFVLELTSPTDQQPVDARKVSVSTSMAMPGMAPMIAGATLTPEKPGRYTGTIELPARSTRQLTVTWDGPAGKGSTKFSVPVR